MDNQIKKVNLLILRGVYISDFTTPLPVRLPQESSHTELVYTEIPKKFTSVAEWPTFSTLKCWICDLLPESYPRFVPTNPEVDKDGRDICDPRGNFCEWNCVVRYVKKEYDKDEQPDILKAVSLFESKFSGVYKAVIVPSPPKTTMSAYCGKNGLTVKQWRNEVIKLNSDYGLVHFKMEHFTENN